MTVATVEENLPARMDYARATSEASILPDAFKRQPANILIAMEVADALGKRPFMVMQEMAVISGKPSFSAKFMRALVREAGHRLRESFTGGVARCVIVRKDDPDFEHVSEWTEQKARDHGYWGKGHWQKNPELMLANRALSECVRSACPEVLGGVTYTPDEVQDFAPAAPRVEQAPKQAPPTADEIMATAPPPEPEADPDTGEVEMITDAQQRKMRATMRDLGLTREDMLAMASETTGRDVASSKDLTKEETTRLIGELDRLLQAQGPEVVGAGQWEAELVEAEVVES